MNFSWCFLFISTYTGIQIIANPNTDFYGIIRKYGTTSPFWP